MTNIFKIIDENSKLEFLNNNKFSLIILLYVKKNKKNKIKLTLKELAKNNEKCFFLFIPNDRVDRKIKNEALPYVEFYLNNKIINQIHNAKSKVLVETFNYFNNYINMQLNKEEMEKENAEKERKKYEVMQELKEIQKLEDINHLEKIKKLKEEE